MAENVQRLVLRFDPQTVEHLGAKMYSHLPNAVAELVANAYDADATRVEVVIGKDSSVKVVDDGHGMSRSDLAEKYLRIGRNRRSELQSDTTESGLRKVSGKKGLGKLALFGIGRTVELQTTRFGSNESVQVRMSYDDMMKASGVYTPDEESQSAEPWKKGTTVTLSDLKRKTPIDSEKLATSLSRLFSYTDTSFSLAVVATDGAVYEVTQERRLQSVDQEFEWVLPESFEDGDSYLKNNKVSGQIVSAKKPLGQEVRGITLYAHGRLVNEPEFFGASESSFAYQYLSGYMQVDFIDELQQDAIATDRRALDWDLEETAELRNALQALMARVGQEWRVRRSEVSRRTTEKKFGVSTAAWVGSVKSPERVPLESLVAGIVSEDLNIDVEQQVDLLEKARNLAPENAEYAWRHFHPEVQSSTKSYYDSADYWVAVQEAIKRYVFLTASKCGVGADKAINVVTSAFGASGKLKVLERLRSVALVTDETMGNLQDGQKHLSMGVIAGFRNPLAHEEIQVLKDNDVFTYQDCLDALGVISHLMRRLDESVV